MNWRGWMCSTALPPAPPTNSDPMKNAFVMATVALFLIALGTGLAAWLHYKIFGDKD